MKTLKQINELLEAFESKHLIPVKDIQQGSEMWMHTKMGVLSASNANKIVAKKGSATRDTYMAELVAQVATGVFPEINSKHMEWGKDNEAGARSSYELFTGYTPKEISFVFKDETFRVGCSPDFIIEKADKGAEIKCPWNSANYILFLTSEKLKSEWEWQAQFQMYVLDSDTWDFVQYDPRMKKNQMKIHTIERNEEKQKTLEDAIPQFISDMDKMLDKAGFQFGDQWARLIEPQKVAL